MGLVCLYDFASLTLLVARGDIDCKRLYINECHELTRGVSHIVGRK